MNQERILMRSPSANAELQRADYRKQKERLLLLEKTGGLEDGQKECFKCKQTKSLNDFYLHPQMLDGRLNKCKECTKSDTARRMVEKRDYVREYDHWRQTLPSRRKKKQEYHKLHCQRYPEKALARSLLASAIRCNRVKRLPCEICGEKAEGHHENYSKPLEVRWLCFRHHRELGHKQKVG